MQEAIWRNDKETKIGHAFVAIDSILSVCGRMIKENGDVLHRRHHYLCAGCRDIVDLTKSARRV